MAHRTDKSLQQWLKKMPGRNAIPFTVDRSQLYRVPELYRGYNLKKPETWTNTFDHIVYEWTLEPPPSNPTQGREIRKLSLGEMVSERLHDTAIGAAISKFLDKPNKKAVGFMGGHDTLRTDDVFRQIAEIACELRRKSFTIVTGGGPGLMEAANFGAFMAPYKDGEFDGALNILKQYPDASKNSDWVMSACTVREMMLGKWNAKETDERSWSLGIPTWYYGNEPPNLFASHSGKYFFNSVREDGLVSVADGGLIFGEGSAGTVQEIFQDASINYYRKEKVAATPMVLLGTNFWNPAPPSPGKPPAAKKQKPAYPLLITLAKQAKYPFDGAVKLTDYPKQAADFISANGPDRPKKPKDEHRNATLKGRAPAIF